MTNWTNEELGAAIRALTMSTTIAKTRTFEIAFAEFPINAIEAMLCHGAQRKFNDAVGGSDKTAETKVEMADAMIVEYKKGVVTKRREGGGVDEVTYVARLVMRGLLPRLLSKDDLKTFRAYDKDVQAAKLDEWCAAYPDEIAEDVKAEMERRANKAAKTVQLAKKVSIKL